MVIGITGSSGAGKSIVCELLHKKYNVEIISADEIAKQLSKSETNYLSDIVEQFGTEVLLENGELNRPKLAKIIYNSQEKREQLNKCTFKYIREEIQKQIKEIENKKLEKVNIDKSSVDKNIINEMKANEPIIVIDAPLLFEAKLEKLCQHTIAVVSNDKNLQIQRIIERDNISKEQAILRLNAQASNEFYINNCEYVILNNGELKEIEEQIEIILAEVKK